MSRLNKISLIGLVALGTLNAGQIQIGGTNGLTLNYVNGTTSCAGAAAPAGPNPGCLNPSPDATPTNFGANQTLGTGARVFSTNLFQSTTLGGSPTPTTSISGDADVSARFKLVTDGTINAASNPGFWGMSAPNVANSTIAMFVPVGIYGVDKVYTMLNDYYGATGARNTSLDFIWGTKGDGTGTNAVERVNLTNGVSIRSAVDCDTTLANVPKDCKTPLNNGNIYNIATTLASGPQTIVTSLSNSISVTATNLWSQAYDAAPTANAVYKDTKGTLNLDQQMFDFGLLHTNQYLVGILIRNQFDNGAVSGITQTATNSAGITRTALSAITVNQVPEPGTILLSLAGLGALGYFRRRKA